MKRHIFLRVYIAVCLFLPCFVFGQTWKINIQQADINVFLSQVAEITHKNFIIDPRVKGKVTVISNAELDDKGVLQLLLSVLNVYNYAAIETPDGIKIVPKENAKQSGIAFDETGNAIGDFLVTRVITIKNTSAADLLPILRPLVPQYGHLASVNSVNALIISDHAENIREIEKLIERLDNNSEGEIRVVSLKHAWAGDVLDLLTNLTGGQGQSLPSTNSSKVIADERTNRLILKGQNILLNDIENLIKQLDQPAQRSNRLHVIPLRYADATVTAELITSLLPTGSSNKTGTRGISIVKADVSMNRLVISAEPGVMSELQPIIQELDIPRAQVLIEAIIVEINMDDSNALGFQWLLGDTSSSSTPAIGTNFTNAGSSISDLATSSSPSLSSGITAGFGRTTSNGFNILGILQAIESNSSANLLSTPKIMTLDNQKSKILVGETRPFQTGGYSNTSNNAFITTERHDIGLTLEVTPHINADNEVKMDVTQIVEAASSETSSLGVITTKREITTTVIAGDQQTIVLGGLMKDDVAEIRQKVPVFGDLPVLGALFRSTSLKKSKQNLLVFIKPTILRDKQHANALSSENYRVFRSIEMTMPSRGNAHSVILDSLLN